MSRRKSTAATEQAEILPLEHRGRQPQRLKNVGRVNPEAIYAAHWRGLNRSIPNLLGRLIAPGPGHTLYTGHAHNAQVTRRDAMVAACVVQWLGTNVGYGFLEGCRKEIDAAREVKHAADCTRTEIRYRIERVKARIRRAAGITEGGEDAN